MRLPTCVCVERSSLHYQEEYLMFVVIGEVIHVFTSVSPARLMLQNLMVQQLAVLAPLLNFLDTFCTPQR